MDAPPQATTIKVSQEKNFDEKQIRQNLQSLFNSVRLRDVREILSHYEEEAVIFDVRDALQIDKKELREQWIECFETSTEFSLEGLDLQVTTDQNCAYAYGLLRSKGIGKEGEEIDLWMRSTHIFRKFEEKWLIVHEHISDPGDFTTGIILQDLKPKQLN